MSERLLVFSFEAGFKIRSMQDVQKFIDIRRRANGDIYWADEKYDYYLGLHHGEPIVCKRLKIERGDIFAPYMADYSIEKAIWNCRKYINARYFNDSERSYRRSGSAR